MCYSKLRGNKSSKPGSRHVCLGPLARAAKQPWRARGAVGKGVARRGGAGWSGMARGGAERECGGRGGAECGGQGAGWSGVRCGM